MKVNAANSIKLYGLRLLLVLLLLCTVSAVTTWSHQRADAQYTGHLEIDFLEANETRCILSGSYAIEGVDGTKAYTQTGGSVYQSGTSDCFSDWSITTADTVIATDSDGIYAFNSSTAPFVLEKINITSREVIWTNDVIRSNTTVLTGRNTWCIVGNSGIYCGLDGNRTCGHPNYLTYCKESGNGSFIYKVDKENGSTIWLSSEPGETKPWSDMFSTGWGCTVVSPDDSYVCSVGWHCFYDSGEPCYTQTIRAACFNESTGGRIWKNDSDTTSMEEGTHSSLMANCMIADDVFVWGRKKSDAYTNWAYVINGTIIKNIGFAGETWPSFAYDDSNIYLLTYSGLNTRKVRAYTPSGTLLWTWNTGLLPTPIQNTNFYTMLTGNNFVVFAYSSTQYGKSTIAGINRTSGETLWYYNLSPNYASLSGLSSGELVLGDRILGPYALSSASSSSSSVASSGGSSSAASSSSESSSSSSSSSLIATTTLPSCLTYAPVMNECSFNPTKTWVAPDTTYNLTVNVSRAENVWFTILNEECVGVINETGGLLTNCTTRTYNNSYGENPSPNMFSYLWTAPTLYGNGVTFQCHASNSSCSTSKSVTLGLTTKCNLNIMNGDINLRDIIMCFWTKVFM